MKCVTSSFEVFEEVADDPAGPPLVHRSRRERSGDLSDNQALSARLQLVVVREIAGDLVLAVEKDDFG
jgi:hypothetical protein